jgi:hypothetical protein
MLLHDEPPDCNGPLGIIHEQDVEDCGHPDAEQFDSYRLLTDRKSFRISPRIVGLSVVKRAILRAYRLRILSVRSAQRLVDLSKCWEA